MTRRGELEGSRVGRFDSMHGPELRWGGTGTSGRPQDEGGGPSNGWKALELGYHSIHYERGPTPFVLVRPEPFGGAGVAQRGSTLNGIPLWAGQTRLLDPGLRHEVKAPVDLYGAASGETDCLRQGSGTATDVPLSTLVNIDPLEDRPGLVEADWIYTMVADNTAVAVIWVPVRGVVLGQLILQTGTLDGGGAVSTVATIQADVEGAVVSRAAAVLAPFTAAGDFRVVLFGETERMPATVMGVVPTKIGGLLDRIGVLLTGTITGESPTFPIRFSYQARLREQR